MSKADRILVFDTETTGLTLHPKAPLDKQPRIIEFGAVVLEKGLAVAEVSFLVNPQQPLPEEITKITGLKDADLKGALPFFGHISVLTALFDSCGHVIAHNLPFDKAMVMNELRRCEVAKFPWPEKETCTVGLYKERWGRNPRLVELYADIMGKPLAQTHRALGDVAALIQIIKKEKLWKLV